MDMSTTDRPNLPGPPDVPGLVFRYFSGAEDWPDLAASYNRSHIADEIGDVQTAETLAQRYKGLPNFDLYKDLLVAENSTAISRVT